MNFCCLNLLFFSLFSLDEIDGRLNDLEKNLDTSIKAADGAAQGDPEANQNASHSKPKNNLNQN